jgi:hypothetical protein
MWERISFWLRLLWDAGKETRENRVDIEALQAANIELFEFLQALAVENERLRDELRHERELRERDLRELKLELRLQISEELRRFPPAKD